jgi:type 1 glutamine amidotransferase
VPTNLVLTGGSGHDFEASTSALVDILDASGIASTVVEDPDLALAALADQPEAWDLVTVNALRWQMGLPRYAHLRDQWEFTLADEQAAALAHHVRSGGGLLACHTAAICFDAEPRWRDLLGGAWDWERSSHPPPGPVLVTPTPAAHDHPLTEGIGAFTVDDEVYGFLDLEPDIVPLLTSPHDGVDHPVLWARHVGQGKVVTDLLGHDAESVNHPDHAEILRRAGFWLTSSTTTRTLPPRSTTP